MIHEIGNLRAMIGEIVAVQAFASNATRGFEVEAELSLQATVQRFPVAEVPVRYRARPAENPSKLHTYRDGYRILMAILTFFRDYKPLTFFGLLATFFLVLSLAGGLYRLAPG